MTDSLQTLVAGVAAGCLYGLLALGYVVVTRASGMLNLAQGAFVIVGAYLTYTFEQAGLDFWSSMVLSIITCTALSVAVHVLTAHRRGSDLFAVLLMTFGIAIAVPPVIASIWGTDPYTIRDPWGLRSFHLGSVSVFQRDAVLILITLVIVVAFYAIFEHTYFGLALRATAMDSEAAIAQGISERFVHATAWAIAGALGGFAGAMLATSVGGGVRTGLDEYALLALPIIILGGLESPVGAILGGLLVGIVQQFAVVHVGQSLGGGFTDVLPYVVMIVVLLVRPAGLFGRKEVRRI